MVNQVQSASSGNTAQKPDNQLTGDSFMTLLVSQLKQQDPTSPQDPTQWVGQLVQFNSLQQLIEINGTLAASATTTPSQ
jgi:flagellar basal-body rod modification protein FlgD